MMDLTKLKKLVIGGIELKQLLINGIQVWKSGYKNWVRSSTEADGVTIYNGGLGCMYGYRMNSSGAVKEQAGANHSGYIPMTLGDVIRAKGSSASTAGAGGNYFTIYDGAFTRLATVTMSNMLSVSYCEATYSQQADGLYMLTVDTAKGGVYLLDHLKNAKYFRISFAGCETDDFIVTINEEIT